MDSKYTARRSHSRERPLPDRIENLLRYYIDCVKEDEGQPVSASFQDAGKRFIPWPFSCDLRLLDDEPRITLDHSQSRFTRELGKRSPPTLLYGYSIYIDAKRQTIPLFTWPVDYELHGPELCFGVSPDWPRMNPEYFDKLAPHDPEEQREILKSLGLLDATEIPLNILERMEEVGLLQNVHELRDPQNLSEYPSANPAEGAGIYNCAALFVTEQLKFARGLVRELGEMVKLGASGWSGTALASILGVPTGAGEDEKTPVEVVPLNEEQREAVRKAATSRLTAVTGPPGTGKSQVVVAMIADAYLRGQRVLFTSRNHKAVDVVQDRVAALTTNPIMARTGSATGRKNYPRELARRLADLLALGPSSSDDQLENAVLTDCHDDLKRDELRLLEESRTISDAYLELRSLDEAQANFEKEYTSREWKELLKANVLQDSNELTTALDLAEKHIADSDIPVNHFSDLRSAIDRLTTALQLVDKRIQGNDVPCSYMPILRSISSKLTDALKLANARIADWDMPPSHFAYLHSATERLTNALELANKHVIGPETLPGHVSLWLSSFGDRRRIRHSAGAVVVECPALSPFPVGRQSFQTWGAWLVQALAKVHELHAVVRDRRRIERIANDAVVECQMLEPSLKGDQTFQAWREWLVQALRDTEKFKAIIKDREQIRSLVTEAGAMCQALEPSPEADQSFQTWRAWITQALSVAKNLEAIDGDRKRIRSIAAQAAAKCPVLDQLPSEDEPFAVWRTWIKKALSIIEALEAIDAYRCGLARLRELRSRDEVACHLRRMRTDLVDSGAKLVDSYARLAPDRLTPADRRAIDTYSGCLKKLASGWLGKEYWTVRQEMNGAFRRVSRHIPAWCVTNLSAGSSLPLEPNLFDLLIVDEASQCDIASALPLLYRSTRAVIIGDPKQLQHITNFEGGRDEELQTAHALGIEGSEFAFSKNSLFDKFDRRRDIGAHILLRDHYRSHSQIVNFSNQEWYGGTLRVSTDYGRLKAPPDGKCGIRWTDVSGTATRPPGGSVFIQSEVEKVVELLTDLLMNQGFDGTVGVVTPFRPQATIVCERIAKRISRDVRKQVELIVDTAHGFQGDERDIILFSPCVSLDLPHGAHKFLKETANLFNVAITRARSLLHVVGDRDACANSGIPHIERFAEYCAEIERSGSNSYETIPT